MKFFVRTPILIVLVRVAWAIQIAITVVLATHTNLVSRTLNLDLEGHYILFYIGFGVLAFLSIFPQKTILIASAVNRNRGYVLFLLVFGILSLEILLRVFYPDHYPVYSRLLENKRFVINKQESLKPKLWSNLWEKDNYFSFRPKANLNLHIRDKKNSYEMSVQTNTEGFRFFSQAKTRRNVMVFGDSVTFGTGVNNGETYSDQLGEILGDEFNILNFGVGGWGFAEYFLAFQKYFEENSPELVIIGVHMGNDFQNLAFADWEGKENGDLPNPPLKRKDVSFDEEGNLRGPGFIYHTPLLKSVALAVFFEKTFLIPLKRFLITIVFDFMNRLPNEEMSLKIISYIAAKSSNLLVVTLPPQYHYPKIKSFKSYVEKLESLGGVRVLDLYPILEEKYKTIYVDGSHFNPEGNQIVAREIANFILKKDLLGKLPSTAFIRTG